MAAVTAAGGLDDRRERSGVGATACAPGGGAALQRPSPMNPLVIVAGAAAEGLGSGVGAVSQRHAAAQRGRQTDLPHADHPPTMAATRDLPPSSGETERPAPDVVLHAAETPWRMVSHENPGVGGWASSTSALDRSQRSHDVIHRAARG